VPGEKGGEGGAAIGPNRTATHLLWTKKRRRETSEEVGVSKKKKGEGQTLTPRISKKILPTVLHTEEGTVEKPGKGKKRKKSPDFIMKKGFMNHNLSGNPGSVEAPYFEVEKREGGEKREKRPPQTQALKRGKDTNSLQFQ